MDAADPDRIIRIAGAGPAGLASAITLARAGRRVIVHEAQREIGYRFQNDLQGLENWTTQQDVLAELEALGLTTAFDTLGCREGTAFDAWGRGYPVRDILHGQYRPAWYKHALWPWARTRYTSQRHDASCDHVDCQCVWCRCGAEPELETRA